MASRTFRRPLAALFLSALLASAAGAAPVPAAQSATPDAVETPASLGGEGSPASPETADTPTHAETNAPTRANATEAPAEAPEASFDAENGALTFVTAPAQTVRGETSLPPGADVEVWIQSGEPIPFLELTATDVRADGSFRATFDVSDVRIFEPVDVRVSVRRGDETLARASGKLYPAARATETADPTRDRSPGTDGVAADSPPSATPTPAIGGVLSVAGARTVVSGAGPVAAALCLLGGAAFALYRR